MKTIKINTLVIAGIITLGSLTACNNKPEDAKDMAEDHNEEAIEGNKNEKDAQFLVDAADINLAEVHMGNLASNSAMMQEVKDFGKKMETSHQAVYNELAALAKTKNIEIPATISDETMKEHGKLSEKSGYAFDKEFCDMMIDGHEKAIDKFQKASEDAVDPDIKMWAGKVLPDLRAHLDEVKMLKEKVKDMK